MNRFRIISTVLLLAAAATALWSQEVTASITGTITDPSGAVVPDVRVVATHAATNTSRAAQSGVTGDYLIPLLPPGTYTLTVTHANFKTYVREGVVLQVNQRVRVDVALQPGVVAERVEVQAELPVINTENATVGRVIDNQSISLMPLNGRLNIVGLLALAPGIQNAGTQDSIPAYGITPQVSGAPPMGGAFNWSINGNRNIPPNIARGLGDWPPLDGIQEFNVITSGATAEFDTPNQVIVVTRSGSNELHGTGFLVNRNRFLAAKNFFATNLPLPQYNRNEFGGAISGPIYIPNVYNGRNKSFFFFNYEGYRRRQAATSSSQVATASMRAGDYSGLATITDPFSGSPFPDNKIPTSRLNAVTKRLADLYPLPNTAGTGPMGTGINLVENIPWAEHVNRWSFRVDHNFSERDQLGGSMTIVNLGPNPSPGSTSTFGGLKGIGDEDRNLAITWNHTFSPTLTNELRAGYLGVGIFRIPQNADIDIGSIIPGLGSQALNGVPNVSITNITGMSEAGGRDRDNIGSLADNLSQVRGNHTLKAGGNFIWGHQNNLNEITPYRGTFTFTGKYTGIAYADFALGWPISTQRAVPGWKSTGNRDIRMGMYFQDDWRVSRTVTLNLGVRYDWVPQQQEARGQAAMFIPSRAGMVVFGSSYPAITQQRLVNLLKIPLSKDIGLPDNVSDYIGNDWNNLAPRIGVAWRARPSTVVRSAFGIYYMAIAGGFLGQLSMIPPFITNETFEQPAGATPTITMSAPFPGEGVLPANPGSQYQPRFVHPYTMQWNFTVEHRLPWNTGLRAGYYGQRNIKLLNSWDLNAVSPAPGPAQPRRPFQPYSTITEANNPTYQNTSNQLQGGVQKRYSHGLQVSAEYQYSRVIGTETYMDPFNFNDSRGSISNIRKHVFTSSYVYDLPIGKGRALLSGASGALDLIAGGWQLTGIVQAMSGLPFSPSFTTSVQGSVGGRPDVVPGAALYPANRTITKYFNAEAFAKPREFTFGNAGYNILWGPGMWTWDASLAKKIPLHENANLQLSLQAFSVLNHPVFGQPSTSISNPAAVGRITSASNQRTVQIGARISF